MNSEPIKIYGLTKLYDIGDGLLLKERKIKSTAEARCMLHGWEVYQSIKDTDDLVKIHDIYKEGDYVYTLMENLTGYRTLCNCYANRKELMHEALDILINLIEQGYFTFDVGTPNFMSNGKDVKLVDMDTLAYLDDKHNMEWFGITVQRLLKWVSEEVTHPIARDYIEQITMMSHKFGLSDDGRLLPNEFLTSKYNLMAPKFFDNISGLNILDIGCNAGYFTTLAKKRGARQAIGIDSGYDNIRIAQGITEQLGIEAEFHRLKLQDLTPPNKFDVAIFCSSYHYIYMEVKDHEKIFEMLSRLTDKVFFESAMDCTDSTMKKFSEQDSYLAEEYTKDNILNAAKKFFNIEHLGTQYVKSREVYWMEKN